MSNPFASWSQTQVEEFNRRTQRVISPDQTQPDGVARESDLHEDIADACRQKGWIAVHSRMDRVTTTALGVPDFILLLPGKVLFIECKSRTGKRTTTQLGWAMLAEHLGHAVYVVRNMTEFWAVVETPKNI